MKIDNLRRYVELRNALTREKQELEQKLAQINAALGSEDQTPNAAVAAPAPVHAPAPSAPVVRRGGGRGRRASGGGLSLREAVLQVTAQRPLTKEEILQGVKQLGYKFSTNNPLNSLGVILYGKSPRFSNQNGRFGLAGGAVARKIAASPKSSGKRQLSPDARERIAAAQRARWAKTKSGK